MSNLADLSLDDLKARFVDRLLQQAFIRQRDTSMSLLDAVELEVSRECLLMCVQWRQRGEVVHDLAPFRAEVLAALARRGVTSSLTSCGIRTT